MFTINIVLSCFMALGIVGAVASAVRNLRRYKKNMQVAQQLDNIILSTLTAVNKTRDIAKKQEQEAIGALYNQTGEKDPGNLDSPAMLGSILTVLISKFGDVRLSINDFAIADEEYVSVYVDTAAQELILSLKHQLGAEDPYRMVNFTDPDDNTFH